MKNIFEYEKQKFKEGYNFVVGIDEVGRGALCGPLVIAAVVFNVNHTTAAIPTWAERIDDSKKLRAKLRFELAEKIIGYALANRIEKVSPQTIDKINIHRAVLTGALKAVSKLSARIPGKFFTIIDGKFVPNTLEHSCEAIIKGDENIFSIACASILAKTYRDNLMKQKSIRFPEYLWHKNKGYGTVEHITAIKQYGLTSEHRKTFCKNFVSQIE